MRARVIAISVVAHGAVIGGLLALAPRPAPDPTPPMVRDIEVVAAPKPKPSQPPRPEPPPARSEPMRDRTPTRRAHAPAAGRVPAAPEPTQPAGGSQGRGEGGGSGDGDGDGAGTGDGEDVLVPVADRSGPPVPLDAIAARVLPYTAEALRDRVTGDVLVSIEVDPLGHVARATIKRGLGHGLDEIATKVALQLRFKPATDRTGAPTTGRVKWRFHFQPP